MPFCYQMTVLRYFIRYTYILLAIIVELICDCFVSVQLQQQINAHVNSTYISCENPQHTINVLRPASLAFYNMNVNSPRTALSFGHAFHTGNSFVCYLRHSLISSFRDVMIFPASSSRYFLSHSRAYKLIFSVQNN